VVAVDVVVAGGLAVLVAVSGAGVLATDVAVAGGLAVLVAVLGAVLVGVSAAGVPVTDVVLVGVLAVLGAAAGAPALAADTVWELTGAVAAGAAEMVMEESVAAGTLGLATVGSV
jgi:hypothetical protein